MNVLLSRSLVALALLGMLAVLATRNSADTDSPTFDRRSEDVVRARTRFSHLTSEVWRYGSQFAKRDLPPVPNNNPDAEPQPHRDRPTRLTLSTDGKKLYVTLPGTEAEPGRHLAVVDVATKQVLKRIEVGSRPYTSVMHPDGRFLVVTNELSNYATVVDTTVDEAVGEIPIDYYCQGLAFSQDGRRAWVANRYLNQVLVLDIEVGPTTLEGRVHQVGGFDDQAFFGSDAISADLKRELEARGFDAAQIESSLAKRPVGGINAILRARCSRCHNEPAGGFVCGPDPVENFLSAVEHAVGGRPLESALLRAVIPRSMGGYGDQQVTPETHTGGVLFEEGEEDLARVIEWIRAAEGGPGIPVGNEGSHPKDVVLSRDGRHLFVGNTGTMDVSIIDVQAEREVSGVFIQNVANHLTLVPDPKHNRDLLVVLTMGAGFGAPNARDPLGAETWDRNHPEAQFTVLRDPVTTDAYPIEQQAVMGPFDAIDGTWNFKMRDIQNDIVAIDLSKLAIPQTNSGPLDYALRADVYESHAGWVRYTSDTVEATTGDVKGDIPPELQRVHGAFPEWAAVVGDRIYLTMAGTFEVVEWKVNANADDPAEKLVPLRVFQTGLRPVGIAAGIDDTVSEQQLFVANQLSETVSVIDLKTGASTEIVVGDLSQPAPATDAEKGELIVHTSVFTSDGDTSCLHCHYRDTGDGRAWGAAETVGQDRFGHLTPGGTLGIPQMRNTFAIQPYYFEGTHRLSEGQGADIAEPASSIDFDRPIWAGDFSHIESPIPQSQRRVMHEEIKERVEVRQLGPLWYDLEERRDAFFRQQTEKYFGEAVGLRETYRYVGAWLGNTTHLLPNPYDQEHPSVQRGRRLFNDATVMCSVCHTPPEFTNKSFDLAHNDRRALPQLTTTTRRDASYTLISVRAMDIANGMTDFAAEPEDLGRVEDVEGSFTTMQLRGIFDRPPVFLHHARARSLREVLCTPGHPGLRRYRFPVYQGAEEVRPKRREIGFNETTARSPAGPLDPEDQIFDTHGGTSHLTPRQIEDLMNFMLSIE